MKATYASLIAVTIALSASGCVSNSSTVADFAPVVQQELPQFLSGSELLSCKMKFAFLTWEGWTPTSSKCKRDIELMVFSAQRIVSKFEVLIPPAEIATLVSETIQSLRPIAESNFQARCTNEALASGHSPECDLALKAVSGSKNNVLEDAWRSLDSWQRYF